LRYYFTLEKYYFVINLESITKSIIFTFKYKLIMSIITLIIILAVIGFCLWAVNTYIPMQPLFKNLINVIVIIATIIWLLTRLGLISGKI
jgi:hypothetical protein